MAPVLAVIISVPLIYGSIYTSVLLMYVGVPLEFFLILHYTKLYKLKSRIYGSLMVFVVIAIVANGIYTNELYSYSHYSVSYTTPAGTIVSEVTPIAGINSDHNFSLIYTPSSGVVQTLDTKLFDPTINITGSSSNLLIHSQSISGATIADAQSPNGYSYVYYYVNTNLSEGIYSFNFSLNNTLHVSNQGPFNVAEGTYYGGTLLVFTVTYLIISEIVFLVGIFLGRSISNSRRYDPKRQNK